MSFQLPKLPYAQDALAPVISKETLEFHYGKHHKTYIDNLNKAIEGTEKATWTLEDFLTKSEGPLFNNAAQSWNHTFYWFGLKPASGGANEPTGALKAEIDKAFGSFAAFKEKFAAVAMGTFGSGWAWLVKGSNGLEIVSTTGAGNPFQKGQIPLFTCDVWEHAYYIDYRNARAKYVEEFWKLVNYKFIEENLASGKILNLTTHMKA